MVHLVILRDTTDISRAHQELISEHESTLILKLATKCTRESLILYVQYLDLAQILHSRTSIQFRAHYLIT